MPPTQATSNTRAVFMLTKAFFSPEILVNAQLSYIGSSLQENLLNVPTSSAELFLNP